MDGAVELGFYLHPENTALREKSLGAKQHGDVVSIGVDLDEVHRSLILRCPIVEGEVPLGHDHGRAGVEDLLRIARGSAPQGREGAGAMERLIVPAPYAVDPLGRGQPLLVVVASNACGLIADACVSAEGIQPLDLGDQRIETDALQPCAERSPASFDPAAAANIHQEEGRFSR